MNRLQNNVALVTGASKGIGRAIARAFAAEGADLIVTARAEDELASLADEVRSLGRQCAVAAVDLSHPGAADAVWAATRAFDRVDILVNNAGIGSSANPKPVVSFDDDFWALTLQVNLTLPYLLCKRALPGMIERRYGRIVNIASIAGKTGTMHGSAYAASKHGLLGLTRSLAMEVVKDGITVNAVCPGTVRSLMNDKRLSYDAKRTGRSFEDIEKSIVPIGRRIEPEEIAEMAVFLAGPSAAACTGQAYVVDGIHASHRYGCAISCAMRCRKRAAGAPSTSR